MINRGTRPTTGALEVEVITPKLTLVKTNMEVVTVDMPITVDKRPGMVNRMLIPGLLATVTRRMTRKRPSVTICRVTGETTPFRPHSTC